MHKLKNEYHDSFDLQNISLIKNTKERKQVLLPTPNPDESM